MKAENLKYLLTHGQEAMTVMQITDALKEARDLIQKVEKMKQSNEHGNNFIADVSERFSSEGELLQWLYLNTPFVIKPKSKHAKTLLVNSFTSNHAFKEVCKHLANKLYNAR